MGLIDWVSRHEIIFIKKNKAQWPDRIWKNISFLENEEQQQQNQYNN